MFAKTFCKPGAFLTVVPSGLLTTLQYNSNGLLEKVMVGYESVKTSVPTDVFQAIYNNAIVPITIPVKGGTTWIAGVFYTDKEFFNEGILPKCNESLLLEDIAANPTEYRFYASDVESLAAAFTTPIVIRNWLNMSKFETLPGFVIPANLTETAFVQMVNTSRYPFKFPLISGYLVYEGTKKRYIPLDLTQTVVHKVGKRLDASGYIQGILHTSNGEVVVPYTDVIRFNINAQSSLVRTSKGKLIYSTCTDGKKRDKRTSRLVCSVCGNAFNAPASGPVCCTDDHCRSRLYPDICHFLNVLNLPEMTEDRFMKCIADGDIICLTDVLLLDEYKDLPIQASLGKLVEAVVPVSVCSDSSVFTLLANRCNNSVQTLTYYMNNPNRLIVDLNTDNLFVRRLVDWLSDGYNITTLTTLLEGGQVQMLSSVKKFEGAPIFRGKNILITGQFKHGDSHEVLSILQSYEATVYLSLDEAKGNISCVLVGEGGGQNGGIIQYARSNNIPIFDELPFFAKYEIDEDIQSNLL